MQSTKKGNPAVLLNNSNGSVIHPYQWKVAPPIPTQVNETLSDFPAPLRQLLYNRGISDPEIAKAYLSRQTAFDTNPLNIKDMDKAVALLHEAVTYNWKIAVYGDYDADGVTASALMYEFLSTLGAQPRVYIPNRFDEGYGLNMDAIDQLSGEDMALLISVDCGVRSVEEVQHARDLGMHVILTDHHLPGDILPPADAIINPRQPGDSYPEKSLAGVGLAYKLAQGYLAIHPVKGISADTWLDLVAIGTVADLAPLTGENRLLTQTGLDCIKRQTRQGLYSLAQVTSLNLTTVNTTNIGFMIGPRLNAAGRMESAQTAFDLLVTKDPRTAGLLAQKIDVQNSERQTLTQEIREQAATLALARDPNAYLIFAASPSFSEGVVGLAAARIVETFYRPAIVGHQSETHTVASCRSIPEFNITQALDQCADLLVRYGGHSAAAGLTVENKNIDLFLARLEKIASSQLSGQDLAPELRIDSEIRLDQLNGNHISEIFDYIRMLEPTGNGNPEAVFCSYNCRIGQARAVGNQSTHLKLQIRSGNNSFDAIAFRQAHWLEAMPPEIDIAYTFEQNNYMGRVTTQLNIKDIKPSR